MRKFPTKLQQVLQDRDGLTSAEALTLMEEGREAIRAGEDPEAVLYEMFGLEPDYIFDLL